MENLLRLNVRVTDAHNRSRGICRCSPRNPYVLPDTDSPRVSHNRFPRGASCDTNSVHKEPLCTLLDFVTVISFRTASGFTTLPRRVPSPTHSHWGSSNSSCVH